LADYDAPISEEYIEPGGPPPHPVGTHTYRVTDVINFDKTAKGQLALSVQEEGVGGKVDGLKRFVRSFHVPYYRSRSRLSSEERKAMPANTSSFLDWLHSLGYHGNLSTLPKLSTPDGRLEMMQLVRSMVGRAHRVQTGIEGYCGACINPETGKPGVTVYSNSPRKEKDGSQIQQQFPEDHSHPGQKLYDGVVCHQCGGEVRVSNTDRNFLPMPTNSNQG
jgi:hypothetical protein